MIEKELPIINKLGLHARAAAKLVNLASGFDSDIQVAKDGHWVNGKSIMGVMMLAAAKGSTIRIKVDGNDESQALNDIEVLIADRFGEDE
ncbi:MAG: HPr family phosphocarrier protein [Gammaproteobacteria bacterium]|nr:HPr family phosphocarrier protein [Gammaproteobacteria bacterium]